MVGANAEAFKGVKLANPRGERVEFVFVQNELFEVLKPLETVVQCLPFGFGEVQSEHQLGPLKGGFKIGPHSCGIPIALGADCGHGKDGGQDQHRDRQMSQRQMGGESNLHRCINGWFQFRRIPAIFAPGGHLVSIGQQELPHRRIFARIECPVRRRQ